jgi:glycosyltransferase involved in cell wall biosynthesis
MISVTILTKNSEKYLQEILETLKEFDEVVILDNGSTDKTLEIATSYTNVALHKTQFLGFGKLHNLAIDLAKNDWILSIDSDEIPSKALLKEVLTKKLEKNNVYVLSRHNYFNNKHIKYCGWHPDFVVRLFNRQTTRFSDDEVHEKVLCEGLKKCYLKSPLKHYPFSSISDFIRKIQHYSDLFAEQNLYKKKASPLRAFGHGFWRFFKSYILQKGFLAGYEGFVISKYDGHTAFYKHIKLYEKKKSSVLTKN